MLQLSENKLFSFLFCTFFLFFFLLCSLFTHLLLLRPEEEKERGKKMDDDDDGGDEQNRGLNRIKGKDEKGAWEREGQGRMGKVILFSLLHYMLHGHVFPDATPPRLFPPNWERSRRDTWQTKKEGKRAAAAALLYLKEG